MIHLYATEIYNQFNLLDPKKYQIHNGIRDLSINDSEVDKSIVIINTAVSKPVICNYVKTIDLTREHDLLYLKRMKDLGIEVPNIHYSQNNISSYIRYMKPGVRYLLKSFFQARGLGQMEVGIDTMEEMTNTIGSLNYEEFNKKYNVIFKKLFNQDEKAILYNRICNNSFYISEIVDFKNEFRVLYFKGTKPDDYIIELRKNYSTFIEEKQTNEEITHIEANDLGLTSDILIRLCELGDSLGFAMLSFDVYIKEDGSFGLFEYSTQFGIVYSKETLFKLKKQINKAIDISIKEL